VFCREVLLRQHSLRSQNQTRDGNAGFFGHCESCRRAHTAPLSAVVYIPSIDLKIVEGEEPESLQAFCKDPPNGVIRSFCKLCGSRVCNTWAPGVRKAAGKEDIGTGFRVKFFPPALLDDHDAVQPITAASV
jgi:hypothetical protein